MKHIRYRFTVLVEGLFLTGLTFLPGRLQALEPARTISQYACRSWTREEGLPANGINAICQTKDGFLWLGTQKGLVRFDGLDFTVLLLPDNPHFRFQAISALCSARDGGLWFGIQHGAFGHYHPNTGFTTVPDEPWLNPGMNVNTVHEAGDGSLWVGATYPATRFIGGQTNLTQPFTNAQGCITLCEDTHKRIWLGTITQKLVYWEGGGLVPFPDPSLTNEIVFALAEDPLGQIWVGTQSGLRCYDASLRRREIPPVNSKVTALLVDRHGVLWIGTADGGLWRWKDGQYSSRQIPDRQAGNYVNTLFEDREGSLWVGTRNGLSQLYDVRFPLFSQAEGLANGSYHAVCASADGGVWATSTAGFSHFDGRQAVNYAQEVGLESAWVKTPYEARNGDLYLVEGNRQIEIFSGGRIVSRHGYHNEWPTAITEDAQGVVVAVGDTLLRASREGLEPFPFQPGPAPPFWWIRNLWVCRDGTLLVASVNGVFRVKNGRFDRLGIENGLPVNEALWVSEDEAGVIWAGLTGGLARIKGQQVTVFTRAQGLFDDYISALVPDHHGWLWIQSGQGIFRVSQSSLADLADRGGGRLQCVAYDGLDSVKTTETGDLEHSACRTKDGRIWFPSPQGLIMVDPNLVPTNSSLPLVHIQRVRINGRDWPGQNRAVVPPGKGELEVEFTAATFVTPRNVQFRYQLAGYEPNWVAAGTRRSAFFTNLKPGAYQFRVQACNADGLWTAGTDSFALQLLPHFYQTAWFTVLAGGICGFLLLGLFYWRSAHLSRKQKRWQEANDLLEINVAQRTRQLARSNASLQAEIEERKRMELEVERIHKQLMAASRRAGQADVATSVLHNVGNVLNSVNVAARLIADSLRKPGAANLAKAVALLEEHAADLGAFLTTDPKGRLIPSYLAQLTRHLASERAATLREVDGLRQNIEHINGIVAMQQNYARASGVTETVRVAQLADEALSMNAATLTRHQVKVIRDYDPRVPTITVDKHTVLQILVNLIRNAQYACDEAGGNDKRITVRLGGGGGQERVFISVGDNGVGIPPENLTKIFSHGFTTRKDGHGFGLHSGALAAKEMGGTLTADSAGPDRGATFILELPLQPPD